jgi:CRP-like cAMP-binding protein
MPREAVMEKQEALKKVYLFEGLTSDELDKIINVGEDKNYKGEDVICKEGEAGDGFYAVLSGAVRISVIVPGVGEEALAILREGDYFGEMALIDGGPRSATAIAHGDSRLMKIEKEAFERLLFEELGLAYKLLWVFAKTLSARLRETDERLKGMMSLAKSF